ncbi:hypothetical protein [Leifsonia sp. NPDC058230]|uniref:hypothetical protein n=1 Tax=Leifsonia sp. NPDC058230 TaxID=3346391 RepID=UPI0036DADD10
MIGFLRFGLLACCIVGSLIGCSGSAATPVHSTIEPSTSAQQKDALQDGGVSWDEYQAAFNAYRACLMREGYELVDPQVKGDLMDFGVPGAAVDSGADDRCYDFNWAHVDQVWQIAHEDTSESAQIIANCLREHRIEPSSMYGDNLELLEKNGIDIADCPVNR